MKRTGQQLPVGDNDAQRATQRMKLRFGVLALGLLLSTSAWGQTNRLIIGIFPFENLSSEGGHDSWGKWLPEILQADLMNATPARFEVYLNRVRAQMTNAGWQGGSPVNRELAQKVASKLRLSKMLLGNFKRDSAGWKLSMELLEVASAKQEARFEIAVTTTRQLRGSMAAQVCQALGLRPDEESLRLWLNSNVSNEVVDRFFSLAEMLNAGQEPKKIIEKVQQALGEAPGFILGRELLVQALLAGENKTDALVEARKLISIAPRLCVGYVDAAFCLEGKEADQLLLEALKVHPGCPSAARPLFLKWLSEERWSELERTAGQAHEAMPGERFTTAVLALARTRLNENESAYDLLERLGSLEDEEDVDVHGLVLSAAAGVSLKVLGRESLWLQRQCPTNREAQRMLSEADESFCLHDASATTNSIPPLYSAQELNTRLSKLLSAEDRALAENPLTVTTEISNTAQSLTAGLTNPVLKAVILFASVVEERLKAEQATNSLPPVKQRVCHYYASRFGALLRSVGIPAWLVHVDLAGELASGYHDRTAVKVREELMQFDPTAGIIVSWKEDAHVFDDLQAIAHHLLQGKDLAKIRIAQKLDNGLWTRLAVIVRLADLQRTEEAEQLWKALEPEATNRWDYYYSRAAIEERQKHPRQAAEWLEYAARLSTNNAQLEEARGQVYSELGQNEQAAEHLARALKLGASQSEPSRRGELEMALKFSQGMKEAGRMSRDELGAQAANGNLHAQMVLANQMFDQGRNDEGLKWLLAAAKQGDPLAQAEAGRNLLLLRGASAAQEALDLLRKAATQDFQKAYYPAALLLYQGKGVAKDEVEATMWAQLGSATGDADCRNLLKELQLFADPSSFAEGAKKAQDRQAKKPK